VECVSPGLYAIAGAASALAGVTRLTGTMSLGWGLGGILMGSFVGGDYV
jgi:hypothetical protein